MAWTDRNRAKLFTWGTLFALEGIDEAYEDSGKLRIRTLALWNPIDSSSVRSFKAQRLADRLIAACVSVGGAVFEPHSNRFKA